MRHDLTPDIVELLERRHAEQLQAVRAMYSRPPIAPRKRKPDEGWLPVETLEDIGLCAWILVIVVLCAIGGLYGPGPRSFLIGLLS